VSDCVKKTCEGDKLCKEIEISNIKRFYKIDPKHPRNERCEVRLEVKDVKEIVHIKYVLLPECGDSVYPSILTSPEKLAKIFWCVCKKFGGVSCLYVGGKDCEELFVYARCHLYRITLSSRDHCKDRLHCRSLCYTKLSKREVEKVIRLGLSMIVLEGRDHHSSKKDNHCSCKSE